MLDDPDEWSEFSRRPAGDANVHAWESNVAIEGMHCAACALTIEDALKSVPGVHDAQVSPGSHRARVVWQDDQVKPSQWMRAVQAAGYRAVPAHDAFASTRRRQEQRHLVWQWGVAGVAMMQVMMYAWPEYVSKDISAQSLHLLRWASWVISLPVVIFSCKPFFRNALKDIRHRRVSMDLPVALGMLITFIVSSLGTFDPQGMFGHEVYYDSLTMFAFFLLTGRWLELRLRDRTAGALEALMHRLPDSVQRQSGAGGWERVSVRRVRVGDVLRVLPGEVFPADGLVLRGETSADESLLTGESTPLARGQGQRVIAGSHNLTAPVDMRVEQIGGDTRYAQIVALMEQASTSKPQIALLADRLAKPFLIFVLLAAGLACIWWWPTDPGHALMIAVAILVVTCPCALSLATPAAMLASAGALARRGVLVRRLQALEALAQVDMVVFDKTGTLTRDAFVLEDLRLRDGVSRAQALALAAALARDSLHPVSRALVDAARAEGSGSSGETPVLAALEEVAGQGVKARLANGHEVRLGSAAFCGVPVTNGSGPSSHLSDGQGWLASFHFREDARDDAQASVAALKDDGVKVRLLSGDRHDAAARLGALVGIDDARGGCLPDDKLALMQQAQAEGATVAMVGDGLNDGPVLAGANVSFAFGRSVPLARAQADFVVLGDRLSLIPACHAKARRTMQIVRQNLGWAAAYNAIGVPLAMMGWVSAWLAGLGMAASSLLVVVNALRLSSDEQRPDEVH